MKSGEYQYRRFNIDVYESVLHVFVSKNTLEAVPFFADKSFRINLDEPCDAFADRDRIKGVMHYVIALQDSITPGTIAHEAVHIADYIFEYINAKHDRENPEPYTYLVGYIANCVHKTLAKTPIKTL